jgi:hypothetical protein
VSIFSTDTKWILFAVESTSCVNAALISAASVCSFFALIDINAALILPISNQRTFAVLSNTISAITVIANTLILSFKVVVNNALGIDITVILITWRFILVLDNFLVETDEAASSIDAVLI